MLFAFPKLYLEKAAYQTGGLNKVFSTDCLPGIKKFIFHDVFNLVLNLHYPFLSTINGAI